MLRFEDLAAQHHAAQASRQVPVRVFDLLVAGSTWRPRISRDGLHTIAIDQLDTGAMALRLSQP